MASGVAVNDECKTAFKDIKMNHLHRYVIFRLSDNLTEIIVDKRAPPDASYDDFVVEMTKAEDVGECRYGMFDVDYKTKEGNPKTKLCFVAWSPESAKIKQKMVYASSRDAFKKAMGGGIAKEIQATDQQELSFKNVLEVCHTGERD